LGVSADLDPDFPVGLQFLGHVSREEFGEAFLEWFRVHDWA
jgi:hypothetical protein